MWRFLLIAQQQWTQHCSAVRAVQCTFLHSYFHQTGRRGGCRGFNSITVGSPALNKWNNTHIYLSDVWSVWSARFKHYLINHLLTRENSEWVNASSKSVGIIVAVYSYHNNHIVWDKSWVESRPAGLALPLRREEQVVSVDDRYW